MPKSEKQRLRRKARVKKLKRKIVRGTGHTWPPFQSKTGMKWGWG